MVITPKHDYYPLTPEGQEQVPRFLQSWITPRDPPDCHVVLTMGALHQIDFSSIRSVAASWHDEFAHVPRPLLVVNIGGPTRNCRYGVDLAKELAASLLNVLASCGSVRISFSVRTPQKVSNIIVKELGSNPKVYIWDGQGPNLHMGHLAWADAFVVTADSVSMISEACSTGKPVYVLGAERCRWKFTEFHKSLREQGVVRPFTGSEDISESWSYPPLTDTADAAKKVHEALAARGWKLKERERQFEIDIRRAKGYEVKKMMEDGNCLFRAVADQVYGDSEVYDLIRQMCIDYMERERDHFSQFITEGFTSYCKRKRRDKVYGNNVEIQAMCEMYNRPIHIYSYTTEPINIFHGSYNTDMPPIRLSYHHGNHYNSLVDPRRLTIGAGLGFSSLRGTNVDKDQVKAAIKAQQDKQINNALLAEGRFYSDLELTEKEIERMVIEVSRAEYLADSTFKQQLGDRESSTSNAEPSSSGATGSSGTDRKTEHGKEHGSDLSSGMQMLLSMGFSYMQAIEAYSIFGDDVDSMVCYLLETGSSSRRKGKATE